MDWGKFPWVSFFFKKKNKILQDASVHDAALKMLEPVEPGMGARATSVSAYKVICSAFFKYKRAFFTNFTVQENKISNSHVLV